MKVTVVIILALILGLSAVIYVSQDRDSRFYRKLAKVVKPLISDPVPELVSLQEGDITLDRLLNNTDWKWFQPELVSVSEDQGSMTWVATQENVWWMNWRGPYLFSHVIGDIDISIRVETRKVSDPTAYPDRDFQFAGLMLRDPKSDKWLTNENYVFNVIGYRGEGLQVETKSTVEGWSDVSGYDWETGDAWLRLVRQGAHFRLFAKSLAEDQWRLMSEYHRPDLPETLQLGFIAYAFSYWNGRHDLSARFSELQISREPDPTLALKVNSK